MVAADLFLVDRYDSFDFPTPPKLDWSLADTNAGMLRESRDMIALRSNREGRSYGAPLPPPAQKYLARAAASPCAKQRRCSALPEPARALFRVENPQLIELFELPLHRALSSAVLPPFPSRLCFHSVRAIRTSCIIIKDFILPR